MTEIIPALMPKHFEELEDKLSLVDGLASMVQLDVMDGDFVDNVSWPYVAGGKKKGHSEYERHFVDIVAEHEDFPLWETVDFEVDLMISSPENAWRDWVAAGAKRIIIHLESMKDDAALVNLLKEMRAEVPIKESFLHVEIGVAINPSTPNETIYPLIEAELVDFVQFMGIERIGFQGEKFDERVLDKIRDVRTRFPDVTISVDGSVNADTAPELVAAGADRLAVGSAIFAPGADENDIAAAMDELYAAIGE